MISKNGSIFFGSIQSQPFLHSTSRLYPTKKKIRYNLNEIGSNDFLFMACFIRIIKLNKSPLEIWSCETISWLFYSKERQFRIEENIKDKDATVDESEVRGNVTVNQRWNDDEIVAQYFLFFVAGFNTSSTTLTSVSYELTLNPDIQQKLYEEIIETESLDQVICETLRKWPPAVQTDRVCVKDHMYNDGHKLKFKVEKGKILHFPIYGIQNDPKYFPEPDKFDPDRFNNKNKGNIISGTYNPLAQDHAIASVRHKR